ncbi:FecR family protein [Chitinophaga japonensis]|uniref:FecR family protein n=1 Tax=Chitinophaga japonensis TaxID=104662 RepID=A0A562SIF6_CHIJA|nr:FecR family protein [Chitinophaga japonensis]TWI80968.1 FecR family protein [Chitinophaga japonensis]
MPVSRIDILIARFHDKTITGEEHAELLELLSQEAHSRTARKFFREVLDRQPADAQHFSPDDSQVLWDAIQAKIRDRQRRPLVHRLQVWKWAGAAAAACLLLVAGYRWWKPARQEAHSVAQVHNKPADLLPGKKNKAVLILADNTEIVLDSAGAGVLGLQGSARIRKGKNGEIVYEEGDVSGKPDGTVYNILKVPNGGEYTLTLSDGSKVWLNAASQLKYPASFTGGTRDVELSGEAYFEVARNRENPFRVHFNKATVEVLGTHFNVNAYANDDVHAVTLLEGSVKVARGDHSVLIKPGEEAVLAGMKRLTVKQVIAEDAIAWKNGYFVFADEDIRSIMKKLSRWYDFTAEYRGDISDERFGGVISKFRNASEVLNMFESTGTIRFQIIPGDTSGKGKKIIVME